MAFNDSVSDAVRHELSRLGMSQTALAARCSVSSQWVTYKLQGERRWTLDDVELVARALDIPVTWLVLPREVVSPLTSRYPSVAARVTLEYLTLVTLATRTTRRYDQRSAWGLAA